MYGYAIRETTSTEGTGTIELDGAIGTGFFTFRDQFASGSKVVYVIASVGSDGNGDREIVEGTLTHGTPDTLTRDKVLESTNSGSKVNWGPGQKVVFCDFAADYTPADRTAESIASASTTSIGAAAGNFVHITGTTTITSFGTAAVAGRRVTVTFDGALTLTHGSNLVLPGAANITTAAGDIATFRADTTTKWICESCPLSWQIATQSDMETATSTAKAVPPGRVQHHPGVAKAWVNFNGTGTVSVRRHYNVSSISDNGTGDYTINFITPFADANYAVVGMARTGLSSGGQIQGPLTSAPTTTAFRVGTFALGGSPPPTDAEYVSLQFLGDQ